MLEFVESLENDEALSEFEKIDIFKPIIEQANTLQWDSAYLVAATIQMQLLTSSDNIQDAIKLFDATETIASQSQNPVLALKRKVIALETWDARATVGDIEVLIEEIVSDAMAINDLNTRGKSLLAVGVYRYLSGDYVNAIEMYDSAFVAFEAADNKKQKAYVLTSLGNVSTDKGDPQSALTYFTKARKIAIETGDRFLESMLEFNMGMAEKELGNLKEAREYMASALLMSDELRDEVGVLYAQLGIAFLDVDNNQWASALELFQKALPGVVASGSERLHLDTLLGIAKSQTQLDLIEQANDNLIKSKELVDNLKSDVAHINYLKVATSLNHYIGNHELAYNLLKEQRDLEEKFFEEEQQKQLQKYQVEFDTVLKEKENAALVAENQSQQKRLEEQEKIKELNRKIIILSLLLVVGLIIFLVVQNKNRVHFKNMALRDFLTGAPNRRAILDYANLRYEEAKQTDMPLAFVLIDIDEFKIVNDRFGHNIGDEVLKTFANALKSVIRQQDRFGRYGGEEWLLILTDTKEPYIEVIFERLKTKVTESDIVGVPKNCVITFSMGVSFYDNHLDNSIEDSICRADKNLYKAKASGRNCFIVS